MRAEPGRASMVEQTDWLHRARVFRALVTGVEATYTISRETTGWKLAWRVEFT